MNSKCFGLNVLLAVSVMWASLARAQDEVVKVTFEMLEAKYDPAGRFVGHSPIGDVKVRLRPDQWQAGSRSQNGYSSLGPGGKSTMKNLQTDVPAAKRGEAYGHLELVGNQPWGSPELYVLWAHGYHSSHHGDPFEVEHHQPSKVVAVPAAHKQDYYSRVIMTFEAPGDASRHYFSSLVGTGMLGVEFTPEGQAVARSFQRQKEEVIQREAAYWGVSSSSIESGLERWAREAVESQNAEDKILAIAYADDLVVAGQACTLLVGRSLQTDVPLALLNARVQIALGRDLLSKANGRVNDFVMVSQGGGDPLLKAHSAFVRARLQYQSLDSRANSSAISNGWSQGEVGAILNNWPAFVSPVSPPQRHFITPPGQ